MPVPHGLPSPARWRTIWHTLGAREAADEALYHEIIACHQDPARHYHTTTHLGEMFALWPLVERLAHHPAEVELAIWFHDAIYEPLAADNERRSAAWAAGAMRAAGLDEEAVERVKALILATRHATEPDTVDEQVLLDLDLAILGAPPERFDAYEHQVRAEFASVPVTVFRERRREILEGFLARPAIYHTRPMFAAREAQARLNLARSIEHLSR
jgi:predicted metal-dependent HD superfamily phosphohydrolase